MTLAGKGIATVGHMLVAGYVGAIGGSFHKPCQTVPAPVKHQVTADPVYHAWHIPEPRVTVQRAVIF